MCVVVFLLVLEGIVLYLGVEVIPKLVLQLVGVG